MVATAKRIHPLRSPHRRLIRVGSVVRLIVALIWFVITVFPVWWMFNIVFTKGGVAISINPRLYPSSLTAGINNIREVLVGTTFVRSYLVSFMYAFLQIAGMLLVCSMAAYEFALFEFPAKNAIFMIILSATMVPQAVTLIPIYRIVAKLHWLNSIQGLVVPGMASAFGVFLLKQFMENLPRELLDAARIDGCSHFGVYWRIARPMSSNAFVTLGVLGFMFAWGSYIWPLVICTKAEWYTVSLAVAQFIGPQSWMTVEIIMTACFLAALPPVIFYIALQRFIVEGVALTGLKG
jgi:multiple sugar transport system permease protein